MGMVSQMALAESQSRSRWAPEAEDLAAVAADALEDAVAVEQAVVVDADLGVFLLVQFAVDVNFQAHGDIKGEG